MKITRKLRNATWTYNEETQELYLERFVGKLDDTVDAEGKPIEVVECITLNRTYAFSLARFLIRVFFRMSMRRKKVKASPQEESHDETSESLSETFHNDDTQ